MSTLVLDRRPQVRLSAKRSAADVQAAAAALSKRGSRAYALVLDVTDSAAVTCAVAEIGDEHGSFQVLVNKVGTNRPKPFDAVIEDDVDALLARNVKPAFFVAGAEASGLKAGAWRAASCRYRRSWGMWAPSIAAFIATPSTRWKT